MKTHLHAENGAEEGTDETDKTSKDGDGARNDVREENATAGAGEPDGPVLEGVGRQVLGASERSNEHPLGGEMRVDDGGDKETGQSESVADLQERMR